ncbi:MAG: beta-lactamase family protein [Deltaproteobacteria bacterium]|nr:beta-lactamase family protein [Deltaproteobacteria bacterium]
MIGFAQASRAVQSAVASGMGSAAALAAIASDGPWPSLSVGRTSSVALRPSPRGPVPLDWPGAPIDVDTPFDLASLTKPMATTTLLALAVTQGRLSLEDPLQRWLPDAQGTALADLPLRLLLGHGSGLPAWHDFFADSVAADSPTARAAQVRRAVLATPLTAPPGSAAVYSDLGFMLLGWVLEVAGGAPLELQFAEQVAGPLGIAARFVRPGHCWSAAVVRTEVWAPRCGDGRPLSGQVHDDNCAALGGVAGHAGLFGSLRDVATWARVWLRAARGLANDLGLPPALVREWLGSAAAPATTWRLGFDTPSRPTSSAGQRAPDDAFGHLGFTGTSVWMSPGADLAVVLLTNRVHPSRDAVAEIRALRPAVGDALWPQPSSCSAR